MKKFDQLIENLNKRLEEWTSVKLRHANAQDLMDISMIFKDHVKECQLNAIINFWDAAPEYVAIVSNDGEVKIRCKNAEAKKIFPKEIQEDA